MIEDGIQFNLPKNKSSVIKVIGVGGGGSNAVNHMKNVGVNGVDFIICNTDAQALYHSPVANKVQLGASLTEGLGAGADPEIGRSAAEESIQEIQNILETGTKMCFITAGHPLSLSPLLDNRVGNSLLSQLLMICPRCPPRAGWSWPFLKWPPSNISPRCRLHCILPSEILAPKK